MAAAVVDEKALDERLARLEAARAWSPRVVSRLEALVREGEDAALFRVNPFALAAERDLDPDEAVDLLLHAAALGLFEIDWLLVCPRCACAVESFARLRAVRRRFRCPQCHNGYEAAMDDLVAVYFNVSPQVRAVRYHRPETLDPLDYLLVFRSVREGRRPDGRPYLDAVREALRGLAFLEPGATAGLAFEAAPGALAASARTRTPASCCRSAAGRPRRRRSASGWRYLGTGYRREGEGGELAPGPVALEIANPTAARGVLAVLQAPPGAEEDVPAALRPLPDRQASADQPDVPEPVPLRGGRRGGGPRDPRRRAAVHRHQGLDRALRAGRRPERVPAGAAALRLAARGHGAARRRRW